MFHRLPLLSLTLAAALLCGCTAATNPGTTNTTDEPATSATESTTVAVSPETPETTDTITGTFTPSDDSISFEPAADADALDDVEQELTTGQDYLEAIQTKLGGQTGTPPSKETISAAIALAEEGHAKLPEDRMMLNVFAGLLFQSLPFESDDVANDRRLRLGELARLVAKGMEPNDAVMAQVLLLEEAKAFLAKSDLKTAWASVKEARDLGFDQTEFLFYDPAFEPLVSDADVSAEIKSWIGEGLEAEFAANEEFPFDFTLQSFAGGEVSLADYAGKPVVVDVWGTWCPPCRKAVPHLVELFEERKDKIAVVGINLENPEGDISFADAKAQLDQFLATQPISYPCLYGNPELVNGIPGFEGFPTMLFIDAAGKVRLKVTGYVPKQKLEVIIDKLLTEQPKVGA